MSELSLAVNSIGDDGAARLAKSITDGSMLSLKALYISYNHFGQNAERELKAACQPYGITGSDFLGAAVSARLFTL